MVAPRERRGSCSDGSASCAGGGAERDWPDTRAALGRLARGAAWLALRGGAG